MGRTFEISFFSELYNIKATITDILRFLLEAAPRMDSEDLYELRLIFSELMCNAVIHGNRQDMSKKVNVSVEVTTGHISACVTDEGAGFDYVSFLRRAAKCDDLTVEHGRGIYLVYTLADSLSFNMNGNQIRFNKRLRLNG